MGNLINFLFKNNKTLIAVKKKFIESYVLDKEKHIIIGIWNNLNKLNTLGNQGIWIGDNNKMYEDKINSLIFGMKTISSDTVILYFENSIKLKFYKDSNDNKLYFTLNQYDQEYKKELTQDILQTIKKINRDSPDLDLIYYFKEKNNLN